MVFTVRASKAGTSDASARTEPLAHTIAPPSTRGGSAGLLWERWNTGRSFFLVVWSGALFAALVLPCSTPDSAGLCRIPETQPVHESCATNEYASTATVATIDPSRTFHPTALDIAAVCECWGASRMQVPEALEAAGPMREIVVAVLDTGVDAADSRVAERMAGTHVVVAGAGPDDVCGHGTRMASTILTVAPNCRVLSIKVADDHGLCTAADVAKGIRIAADEGAAVINLSLVVESTTELEKAVRHAWYKGAVIVAAAGMPACQPSSVASACGDGLAVASPCLPSMSSPVFPASYPDILAVTGTNQEDELAPLSNRADWVDVAAPGFRTCLAAPDSETAYLSGTSTAAAHLSGVAAILCGIAGRQDGDDMVNRQVREAIEATATPIAVEGTGHGIVNALSAVHFILHDTAVVRQRT